MKNPVESIPFARSMTFVFVLSSILRVSDLLGAYQRTRLVGTIQKGEGNLLPGYAIILVGCAGFVVTVNMWIYDRAVIRTYIQQCTRPMMSAVITGR